MGSVMASRALGYLREMYIAWAFGAGHQTDAYFAAFQIPDYLNYILAGGTASITFISIYTRHVSQDDEAGAQRAFNAIITIMSAVLVVGTVLMEIFTPQIVRLAFHDFSSDQVALCVHLARILLPGQIFFYAGGVISAVLLAKRMFLYPALSPAIYNIFIIAGGLIGARTLGISALAYGALAGAILGPFLINAVGAAQGGLGYRFSFDWHNQGFREWVKLSIPLMLGVSLVSADDWILRYFASGGAGDISRLNYAKRLFAVPISILGQATGQASMPFFASLWEQGKRKLFADTVNQTVYRISAVAFLASAWMMAAALPVIDLAFRHGHFTFADARQTATYSSGSRCHWRYGRRRRSTRALLRSRRHVDTHGGQHHHRRAVAADLSQLLSSVRRYRTGDCLRRRHPHAHGRSRLAASSQEDSFVGRASLGATVEGTAHGRLCRIRRVRRQPNDCGSWQPEKRPDGLDRDQCGLGSRSRDRVMDHEVELARRTASQKKASSRDATRADGGQNNRRSGASKGQLSVVSLPIPQQSRST